MKAVWVESPGNIELYELPAPLYTEGSARIRVLSMGAGDVEAAVFTGRAAFTRYPRILGREVAGVVLEGEQVGARVVLDPFLPCGRCEGCAESPAKCMRPRVLGIDVDGGMGEEIVHPEALLHILPDTAAIEQMPLVEPLSRALHAVRRAVLTEGEAILIFGASSVGLMVALLAQYYQAAPILVDSVGGRLDIARAMGITQCVHSLHESVNERVKEVAEGNLAKAIVECTGTEASIAQAFDVAAFGARIALLEPASPTGALKLSSISEKELEVFGVRNSARDFPTAINLLTSGVLPAEQLMGKRCTMEELPEAIRSISALSGENMHFIATR